MVNLLFIFRPLIVCNLRFDHKGGWLGASGAGWKSAFRFAGERRSRGREVATCKRGVAVRGLWFTSNL